MSERTLLDVNATRVISLPAETQYAAHGVVSRTVLRSPTTRVVLMAFEAGQGLTEHTSTAQALVQVLSGKCEFRVGPTVHTLATGDLLLMAPHEAHAVTATEQCSILLTLVRPEIPRLA